MHSICLTACAPESGNRAASLWGRGRKPRTGCVAQRHAHTGNAGPDALLVPYVQGGCDPRSRIVMARWAKDLPAPTCVPHSRTAGAFCSCGMGASGRQRELTADAAMRKKAVP